MSGYACMCVFLHMWASCSNGVIEDCDKNELIIFFKMLISVIENLKNSRSPND